MAADALVAAVLDAAFGYPLLLCVARVALVGLVALTPSLPHWPVRTFGRRNGSVFDRRTR